MAAEKVLLWDLDGSGNYCLCSSHSDAFWEQFTEKLGLRSVKCT